MIKRIVALLLVCYSTSVFAALNSAAFYYGNNPPLDQLNAYDITVLDPQANIIPKQLPPHATALLAYVSLGEVAESASYRSQIKPEWILGKNKTWHSVIMNETNPAWQVFFMQQVIQPLWDKGYRGFFLDTLDAYQAVVKTDAEKQAQQAAIIALIKQIREKYPDATLVLNRGFEIIPSVANDINAVAAESLFERWNQAQKHYETVPQADYQYLLAQLQKVQALNIPVIIIDYVNPSQKNLARETASKIRKLGFIPYITDGLLQNIGVSDLKPIQRKVLVFYTLENKKSTVFNPEAFTKLALPLEYLGYIPVFQDAALQYPKISSHEDYAGIIVLTNALNPKAQTNLYHYLLDAKKKDIKILFLANFGFAAKADLLKAFDISIDQNPLSIKPNLKFTIFNNDYIGYETKPRINAYDYDFFRANNARVLLQIGSDIGLAEDAVAITPWGGYALDPYIIATLPNYDSLWLVNPMKLIASALRLRAFPIPDNTTENGTRLAFVHIDGDGFLNNVQFDQNIYAAVELKKSILDKYALPTAFSVVTGDIASNGLYPTKAAELQKIAKSIYALPWIEPASHTFSHPFDWIKVKTAAKNGIYNLPIPNYKYSEKVEIANTANYIKDNLAPKAKQATIILWSGYANLDESALKILNDHHLLGMNGGETVATIAAPYLSLMSPQGLQIGSYFQVFAPIGNEEHYTNGWTSPLYGYRHVIETFDLTDKPMRLKPVDIYYHIYSATTEASLNALHTVYQWAISHELNWIYPSEYIEKTLASRTTNISTVDNGWVMKTTGIIREFRYPATLGYPDFTRSQNIIGFKQINDMIYVHLGDALTTKLILSDHPPTVPYLASANGKVTGYTTTRNTIYFRVYANQKIILTLHQSKQCQLLVDNIEVTGKLIGNNIWEYRLNTKDSNELKLDC